MNKGKVNKNACVKIKLQRSCDTGITGDRCVIPHICHACLMNATMLMVITVTVIIIMMTIIIMIIIIIIIMVIMIVTNTMLIIKIRIVIMVYTLLK